MDRHRHHYAIKMHSGHLEGENSQHNAGFTVSRMESKKVMVEPVVEVDWREEMSQQIKKLKEDCFSELLELHQRLQMVCPYITKEQLEAQPKCQNKLYRFKLFLKEQARVTLNFLLLEKDKISENLRGKFSMYEKTIEGLLHPYRKSKDRKAALDARLMSPISRGQHQAINHSCDLAPSDDGSSSHQNQQEQPISSWFPEKSHGSLQSSPTNKLQEGLIPFPITNPGIVEVSSQVATLSSDSVKFTFQSPVSMTGVVPAASTCAPVMPASSEYFKSVAAQLVENSAAAAELVAGGAGAAAAAAANEYEQVNPTMTATPIQVQIADSAHRGAETVVAKKPIDRLIEAVRASPPATLYHSANSMRTVTMNDQVPHMEIDEFQDWGFFSEQAESSTANKKMKHFLESRSPCLESSPQGDMDGGWIPFDWNAPEVESNAEHGAKRPRTMNAKDALLDEIRSANNMLINTFISIIDDSSTDAITSTNGGTLVEFSYTAISLIPDLKLLFADSEMPIVLPVKILVPVDYPKISPVLIGDQWNEPLRKRFLRGLDELPKPMTVTDMARVWDDAVWKAIVELGKPHGGGTSSSMHVQPVGELLMTVPVKWRLGEQERRKRI